MIHRIRPVAASRKWPKMSPGGKRLAPVSRARSPPRLSQVPRRTAPPRAVMTQVMRAATFMVASLPCTGRPTGRSLVGLGLGGLVGDADAVAVGEPAAQPP